VVAWRLLGAGGREKGPLSPAGAAGSAAFAAAAAVAGAGAGRVGFATVTVKDQVQCSAPQCTAVQLRACPGAGRRYDAVGRDQCTVAPAGWLASGRGLGAVPAPGRCSALNERGERFWKGVRAGFRWSRGLFYGVSRGFHAAQHAVSRAVEVEVSGEDAKHVSTWAAELVGLRKEVGGGAGNELAASPCKGEPVGCCPFVAADWLEHGGGSCVSQCPCEFGEGCEGSLCGIVNGMEQGKGGSGFWDGKPLR
jgi:hypothetical protein